MIDLDYFILIIVKLLNFNNSTCAYILQNQFRYDNLIENETVMIYRKIYHRMYPGLRDVLFFPRASFTNKLTCYNEFWYIAINP